MTAYDVTRTHARGGDVRPITCARDRSIDESKCELPKNDATGRQRPAAVALTRKLEEGRTAAYADSRLEFTKYWRPKHDRAIHGRTRARSRGLRARVTTETREIAIRRPGSTTPDAEFTVSDEKQRFFISDPLGFPGSSPT